MSLFPVFCFFVYAFHTCSLYCTEYQLKNRKREIAGLEDQAAQAIIQKALATASTNMNQLEGMWGQRDGDPILALCGHMSEPIAPIFLEAFWYYARKEPERFKKLHSLTAFSISPQYKGSSCSVRWGKVSLLMEPEYVASLPVEKRSEDIIRIECKPPVSRFSNCIFIPIKPELFVARIISAYAHEGGHVLNEYEKSTPLITKQAIQNNIISLPAFCSTLPLIVAKYAPYFFASHPLISIGTPVVTACYLFTVALLREQSHAQEYAADATALVLCPRSIQYGDIVFLTEAICRTYEQKATHYCAHLWKRIKRFCVPGHDTHPSNNKRLLKLSTLIIEATAPEQREATITQLHDVATETIENYLRIQKNCAEAQQAAQKARQDITEVFVEIRSQFQLEASNTSCSQS